MKKVTIIPVDIGVFGTVTDRIETETKKTGIDCRIKLLQKRTHLRTDKNNPKCEEVYFILPKVTIFSENCKNAVFKDNP